MLTFIGDVFLKDPVELDVSLPGRIVLNLESPLTGPSRPYPRKINLRADPANLTATFPDPPLAVSLANNHALDFYDAGLEATFDALDRAGVRYFGASRPGEGFNNPLIVEVDGVRVALLGYADRSCNPVLATATGTWVAELTIERLEADLEAARLARAERIVVQAHWGHEHVPLPDTQHVVLARRMVDMGVDLVIGHHSHCIQSFETYRGKPIFYGIGNCIFPPHRSPSYFDEAGNPGRAVDSRPAPWNRRSLAVSWEPASRRVSVQPLHFSDGRLTPGRFSPERYRLRIDSLERHDARFRRAYRWGQLRHTLARFVSRPKLPGLNHIRQIGKVLRSAPPT